MSRSSRPGPYRGALAVVTGAGMLAATLGTAGSAFANDPGTPPPSDFTAGSYVVVMAQKPAATYEGEVRGLAATKPEKGEQLDGDAPEVRKYQEFLQEEQQEVAELVDAEVGYSYTTVVNGFSAELSPAQAAKLSTQKGVLAVVPDEARQLDTVTSPDFLGLTGRGGVWEKVGGVDAAGEGVVVGIIDSGITPENPSFAGDPVTDDSGDPDAVGRPYRDGDQIAMLKADGDVFMGECEEGEEFSADLCNSKMVSARYFADGFLAAVPEENRGEFEVISARDSDGHGTHTAGTAVGNAGVPMSVDGRSFGEGSGMAPAAKLAVYKVCWEDDDPDTGGCYTSDSIRAIDQAVLDGVDVLNYSISGSTTTAYDPVELAFLSAASAGVFVAASAGNSGPGASTVAHNSPWLTTVAASTHVNYEGTVELGNGDRYRGASISDTGLPEQTPVVLASQVGLEGAPPAEVALCAANTLDPAAATGKVVVCDRGVYARVDKSAEVARAGGVGTILANVTPGSLDADFHSVPTVHVDEVAGAAIKEYVTGTGEDATAALLPGDQTGQAPTATPVVAGFSSRGPALANSGDLLKPDISAPGVSVLAAVAPGPNGGRDFNLLSGTSMSSPHVAGLAALILGEKPEWSPMAVKSAMMTTAYDLKNADGSTDTNLFNQGAGHVDPTRFLNPGLVYESGPDEWLAFLQGQGFDLGIPDLEGIDPSDLNQPSVAVGSLAGTQTITRTVTAVTPGLYRAKVDVPGMNVRVVPSVLNFTQPGQSKTFQIRISRDDATLGEYAQGHLTWNGGRTTVRSPIVVKPVSVSAPSEVSASAADGSLSYRVTPGTNDTIDLSVDGLVAGESNSDTVGIGPAAITPTGNENTKVYRFNVPEGTSMARVDLVAGDRAEDLDLYLVNPEFTGFVPSQGAGATSGASERIDLVDPAPGNYYVFVHGYSAESGATDAEFTLRTFAVPGADAGNATVSPDPLKGRQGRSTEVTVSWDGLEEGTPYLGVVRYSGAQTTTVVTID
ncbi:S8 family serine peptidase [Thalassiella azotivora]